MLQESSTTSKTTAIIVAAISILVVFGWVLDIWFLKSLMMFITALGFFLSSIILLLISYHHRTNVKDILLAGSTLFLLLIMLSILASMLTGILLGIETLFAEKTVGGIIHGRPSIGTIAAFLLIAIMGFVRLYVHTGIPCRLVGIALCIIGGVALFGTAAGTPLLYYRGFGSAGMPVFSAVLFILLGAGLLNCRCYAKEHKE